MACWGYHPGQKVRSRGGSRTNMEFSLVGSGRIVAVDEATHHVDIDLGQGRVIRVPAADIEIVPETDPGSAAPA